MIESKDMTNNNELQLHGERPEVITVTPSIWNGLRSDILKIEHESFSSSLADSEKDLRKLVDSPTGIFLALSLPPSYGVIGYIAADLLETFSNIPGATDDPHFGKRDTIYVASVAVLPNWRGRGFGTALMRECLQVASQKGIERVTTHIETGSVTRTGLAVKVLNSFRDWYGTGRTFDYVEIVMEA
jgi:ribosomal protein S18 acetylase RimI-like enzyme